MDWCSGGECLLGVYKHSTRGDVCYPSSWGIAGVLWVSKLGIVRYFLIVDVVVVVIVIVEVSWA